MRKQFMGDVMWQEHIRHGMLWLAHRRKLWNPNFQSRNLTKHPWQIANLLRHEHLWRWKFTSLASQPGPWLVKPLGSFSLYGAEIDTSSLGSISLLHQHKHISISSYTKLSLKYLILWCYPLRALLPRPKISSKNQVLNFLMSLHRTCLLLSAQLDPNTTGSYWA